MKIAHAPTQLERQPRAVAIGTFDGVHRGHRQVIETALATGPSPTVVTFDPHPRIALGYEVELLATLERRLELIAELGVEEVLVVAFTLELAELEPEDFVRDVLAPIGTRIVVAGDSYGAAAGRFAELLLEFREFLAALAAAADFFFAFANGHGGLRWGAMLDAYKLCQMDNSLYQMAT